MPNNNPQTTDNSLEWFAENLPPQYLNHPEYFLYSTALDVQKMQDIPENRRRFKKLLVERQVSEGIELPEIDQKQLHDFMNPKDKELKLQRSEELLELTTRHLEQTQDFAQAQCLAVLELFHREAPFRQVEMDEKYFSNRELIKSDLIAYLQQAKGDSLKDLNSNNPKYSDSIQIQTGENVKWITYLDRASSILLRTKQGNRNKKSDNPHRRPGALKVLLRIVGVDIPEYIPVDEKYFSNPEYVKADLTAYLKLAVKKDKLKDLNTNNPSGDKSVQIQSGNQLRWETYLDRASGVLFQTKQGWKGKKSNNPHRPVDALKALLRIAGETVHYDMDEKYFSNPKYVKADFTAYLQQAKGDSLKDLNTENPKPSVSIQTQSGEKVKYRTYLDRASSVLFGTKGGKKSKNFHRPVDALKYLIQIATAD